MGLINLDPTLHQGEEVRWRRPAARSLENRTVAGVLYLTTEAVVFMPNRLNRRRDLISTRLPLSQLRAIDTAAPTRSLAAKRSGALRRRLWLTAHDGADELFVLNHPERAATELRDLLAQ